MLNEEMILSTLNDIEYSIKLILKRFEEIENEDDFLKDLQGIEKLDSISMRLIAIGEGFKNIDKLSNKELLKKYPQIIWKDVKGIRDILSHHYFDIDAQIVYDICQNEVMKLLTVVQKIQKDIKNDKKI